MSEKIKDAFNEIHANDILKQKTFENIISKNKKAPSLYYKLKPVMALFIVVLLSGVYFYPKSYISIDINPSIEFKLNIFDMVIDVEASNQDGQVILENVDLKHLSYLDALEQLNNSEVFNNYSDQTIEITVVANNIENSEKIMNNINESTFSESGNVTCFSANKELKDESEKFDISCGKYRAYLELLEVNPNITIEEIKDLSMGNIRSMINGEENFDNTNKQGNKNDKEHGNRCN